MEPQNARDQNEFLPESVRLIAADGSKVATGPHLVPESRGYSFNTCIAPRCETHMRFKPYTFSYVFIIIACVNSKHFFKNKLNKCIVNVM